MDSMDRVLAVLSGNKPDRLPFSFWCHFASDLVSGPAAVEAHVHQRQTYQTDFIKVMNDNPYPHDQRVETVDELALLRPLSGTEAGFAHQLDLISALRAQVGPRVLLTTTIFNAWAVLRTLIRPPKSHLPPTMDSADGPSDWLLHVHTEAPERLVSALDTITDNLARFAERCLDAGADGIFLSVRDDWVDREGASPHYLHLVQPSDLKIIGAASAGRFNILHVCGRSRDLTRYSSYPVHAINWADRSAGPSISGAIAAGIPQALCCGIDNLMTLPEGNPDAIRAQVHDAIAQAGSRPIIIAPGCTFNPDLVFDESLRVLSDAVRTL